MLVIFIRILHKVLLSFYIFFRDSKIMYTCFENLYSFCPSRFNHCFKTILFCFFVFFSDMTMTSVFYFILYYFGYCMMLESLSWSLHPVTWISFLFRLFLNMTVMKSLFTYEQLGIQTVYFPVGYHYYVIIHFPWFCEYERWEPTNCSDIAYRER